LNEYQRGIEMIRKRDPELVSELIRIASCDNGYYRRSAIIMLGQMGPFAKAAIPSLENASKDASEQTRKRAIEALEKIDPMMSQ